jgi:2-polyprenyl-3-methyl-5-hydroxy-6-metoxy-1,4-benzoquinol methylase/glycosyltransferase involved in cell wall biosynthesis
MNDNRQRENGYCVVCGCHSSFRFDPTIITPQLQKAWGIPDNLVEAFNRKESMFCSRCDSSMRIRRLATVLMQTVAEITGICCKSFVELVRNEEFRGLKIAEINACGALHAYLKDHPNLCYSEWWVPHANPGEVHDGVQCEDLQCLTYPDNYFDIILTSETLEHVPEPDKAWHEIYRTLKGGGYHIFTIPVIPWQRQTFQRARVVNGLREDLVQPAYHGASVEENMFVYTDFGMDVVEKLNKMGLNTEVFYVSPEVDLDVAMVFRSHKTGLHAEATAKGRSPLLEWTGERYLPWLEDAAIGYEHLHRYAYATQFVQKKKVLDLACGEGYGSYLLAKSAKSVVGIDIDEHAIKHARNKYIKQNLEFKVGSITEVPIAGEHLFEVVVCFEALEHIEDHHGLLSEVKRLLTADGVFIVSTPNKTVYTDEPQFNNPFHVHELYFDEFRELFEKHFKTVKFLGQRISCSSNIWPVFLVGDEKVVDYVIDRNPKEFVFVENDKRTPLYFIAIASDTDFEIEETRSALIDVSDALLKHKENQIAAHVTEQERLLREIGQLSSTLKQKENQIAAHVTEQERLLREIAAHVTEQERLLREIGRLSTIVQAQQQTLAETAELQARVRDLEAALGQRVEQHREELESLIAEKGRFAGENSELKSRVEDLQQRLRAIEDSLAWALIVKYRRLRDMLSPQGTHRRKAYDFLKNAFKGLITWRTANLLRDTPESPGRFDSVREALTSTELSAVQSGPITTTPVFYSSITLERTTPNAPVDAKLTVVIPAKNGIEEDFESTLQAIQGQRGIADVETVVVDSGSTDSTVKVAEAYGAKVYHIPPSEFNHGLTRNFGAEQGTGEFILFIVQDAIPATDDLFYEMARALRGDPNIAGVSVRQVPKSNADIYACWEIWNHYRAFFEAPRPKLANLADIDRLPRQQLRRLAGLDDVCAMVRRQVWEKIRFKPTPFAEDLEFGLSCVKEGYNIELLSHRGVIHSHTRSAFYGMARHYTDLLVLLKLFREPSQPKWVGTLSLGQLLFLVHRLYFAINEFAIRTEEYSTLDPARALGDLLSFVSKRSGTNRRVSNLAGDARLDEFFGALESVFEDAPPTIDACELAFHGTINSILQFIGNRYSALARGDVIALMHKAFAGATGSVLGEYCFWHRHNGTNASQLEIVDDLFRKGAPV